MGKAIVISITIVVLVMLIIGAAMWATREQRGVGFTPRQERARQRLLNRWRRPRSSWRSPRRVGRIRTVTW